MSRSEFLFIFTTLALIFLFQGEPDVWDRLHERAMNMPLCK
jgi:hypothetical protein